MGQSTKKLIFVYNADSSLFDQVSDFAHKMIAPKTYACSLCKLTYGNLTMKKEWKEFVSQLSMKVLFLYKDQFHAIYSEHKKEALPAVFIHNGQKSERLISSKEMKATKNLDDLKKLVVEKI